jgi:hypothetical protein
MARLVYIPDEDVKVHEEGAIRLICKAFQSHENGLPEWLKNSADEYIREDAPEGKRVILVVFHYGRKDRAASISCLDFSGMTSGIIEQHFRVWADPEAARRGGRVVGVQGGHGNGGKCYMTQMFEDYGLIQTARRGRGNRYGVSGGSIRFGYISDRAQGRDFPVANLKDEFARVLAEIGCSVRDLPEGVRDVLQEAEGFTLVKGVGPKGYGSRIPVHQLIASLEEHPQMMRTLELCKVYVLVNGTPWNEGRPLRLPEIEPMEEAQEPRVLPIPEALKDPATEDKVSTTDGGRLRVGTLTLRTSKVSMRYGKKGRHDVVFRGQSGYIGYIPVPELDIQSEYRDRIYGECHLEALEPYKQNERARLAQSPLTRAVERFISQQIQLYAREFEARERRRYAQEEKDAISKMNEALDRWKNRFLNELMGKLWGPGSGLVPHVPAPLPTGKPAKLELTLSHPRAGVGVAFRPSLKFFDSGGRRIRPVAYRWVSEDNNVAMVDEDLSVINTFTVGRTAIHAETLDGRLASNKAPLEVVHIREIRIVPSQLEMHVGSRQKLEALCRLGSGGESGSVYLEWTESNPYVAKVSSAGLVFGFSPGETQVTAVDDRCLAKEPALVRVSPGGGRERGDQHGRGVPLVLISGDFERDPDTQEYVYFSSEEPPVAQRPKDVDRNIWWINSAAPLAKLYLDTSKGYGHKSREWRMYHLERYIDAIVQIALTHGPTETGALSPSEWIIQWGAKVAEIQAAAAADLTEFIATGQLPMP